MSNKPPVFSLILKGSEEFPRYLIAKGDIARNPVFWNSESRLWHEDESEATVFSDVNKALWEHHDLKMDSLKGKPCHRFVAPIYLEFYGDEKPELNALRKWLEKAIRIVANSPQYGDGPNGSVGVLVADFSRTREAK